MVRVCRDGGTDARGADGLPYSKEPTTKVLDSLIGQLTLRYSITFRSMRDGNRSYEGGTAKPIPPS